MGSAVDKARGRAKELAGRLTGDERLEAEGRTDQAKAKAREAVRKLRARARGVMDSIGRS
ncbi:CsbD family protein [Streptomyces sp. NPDC007863]|uniref:CsbD family protein n=1 Tax=Streptomyces sp. NPDC007863 TaxID=3154894 RepID=UPI0033ECAA58